MAQIVDFRTPDAAKQAAENMTQKMEQASQERKSVFEELMNQIENINPALGGFEELGALLALPDEQFALISPFFR